MEKYGVENVTEDQERALAQAKAELAELESGNIKEASPIHTVALRERIKSLESELKKGP